MVGNYGTNKRVGRMKTMDLKLEIRDSIIQWAKECKIRKVVLFGSRARGDNKLRSDIDLAVYGGNISKFSVGVDEEIPTLLYFDVVNMDGEVQEELRNVIEREGIVLYEET